MSLIDEASPLTLAEKSNDTFKKYIKIHNAVDYEDIPMGYSLFEKK